MPAKMILKTTNRIRNSPLKCEGAEPNVLRELQSETQEELDSLLQSVLDKAFKGEL